MPATATALPWSPFDDHRPRSRDPARNMVRRSSECCPTQGPPPAWPCAGRNRSAAAGDPTRDVYAQPWVGAGRAPFAAPALLLLLGLLLVGLAVAGSQLLQPRMTVVAPAPTTSSTAIAPSQEPSPQPTPVDTRPPAIPATAAMFADVFKVAPFGDVAWVSTRTAIYRTEDAGATWRTVQPDGWVPFADAFVDADTAYVPLGDGTSVAITHDRWLDLAYDPPEPRLECRDRGGLRWIATDRLCNLRRPGALRQGGRHRVDCLRNDRWRRYLERS